jgi:hypothetical protein
MIETIEKAHFPIADLLLLKYYKRVTETADEGSLLQTVYKALWLQLVRDLEAQGVA